MKLIVDQNLEKTTNETNIKNHECSFFYIVFSVRYCYNSIVN